MIPDIETLLQLASASAVIVPIVVGVVQVLKKAFNIGTRYIPLVSVGVGLATGLIMVGMDWLGGVVGVIIGLSACGLYDFGKKTVAGKLK